MNEVIGRSEIKIPGGKLIRVECTVEKKILLGVVVTGDFFLHPEEAIQELERDLTGLRAEPEIIRSHVMEFFRKGYEIVGATPEDFAKAVVEAASKATEAS
ncbi:MAG: lipoate protein ligase C-terminal domain-containing protein [Candidatus Bathyarchaeia archaeon]